LHDGGRYEEAGGNDKRDPVVVVYSIDHYFPLIMFSTIFPLSMYSTNNHYFLLISGISINHYFPLSRMDRRWDEAAAQCGGRARERREKDE